MFAQSDHNAPRNNGEACQKGSVGFNYRSPVKDKYAKAERALNIQRNMKSNLSCCPLNRALSRGAIS